VPLLTLRTEKSLPGPPGVAKPAARRVFLDHLHRSPRPGQRHLRKLCDENFGDRPIAVRLLVGGCLLGHNLAIAFLERLAVCLQVIVPIGARIDVSRIEFQYIVGSSSRATSRLRCSSLEMCRKHLAGGVHALQPSSSFPCQLCGLRRGAAFVDQPAAARGGSAPSWRRFARAGEAWVAWRHAREVVRASGVGATGR
jgi:hypothetical protein